MVNYAVIQDEIVVNIVVSEADFAQSQGWISSETAKIGDSYDAETGEFTSPEPAPTPVTLDVLSVDTWQIDADSTAEAVATYTSNDTVNFVVDGVAVPVEPVDSVATLMISADAPGAIPVQVRAQQFVIIAVEGTP